MAGNRSTTANYCILTIPHDRIKFAELVQHCVQPVDFIGRAAHRDPSPVFSLAASLLAFLGNRPAPVLERSSLKHGAMKCGIHRAVLFLLVLAMSSSGAMAQVNVQGQWSTLPYLMPINPVHVALMHNGKVPGSFGLRKRRYEYELAGCGLGPACRHSHCANRRLGHVLQWHGGTARWPAFHQWRHAAV